MESGRGEVRVSLSRKLELLGQEEAPTWAFLPLGKKVSPELPAIQDQGSLTISST